jgi:methylenetetrahydrofolate dehydrogenase (NAD+)
MSRAQIFGFRMHPIGTGIFSSAFFYRQKNPLANTCCSIWPIHRQQQQRCSLLHFSTCGALKESGGTGSTIVDVARLAQEMRSRVREYTANHPSVRLVGILVETEYSAASEKYSFHLSSTLKQDGIVYTEYRCKGNTPGDVEATIQEMNHSDYYHGILVFYPIFPQKTASFEGLSDKYIPSNVVRNKKTGSSPYYLNPNTGVYYKTVDDYLRDCVAPSKDVEGFRSIGRHRLLFRARGGIGRLPNDFYIPCTATAVLKILERIHLGDADSIVSLPNDPWISDPEQQCWMGSTITIVNRSTILGRPLAAMLALGGATVFSVDDKSIIQFQPGGRLRLTKGLTLNDCLKRSSIVVTAVPGNHFCLDSSVIQDHTTIIDVSYQSNVHVDSLLQKTGVKLIANVGKVTVAALEHNLIRLHHRQNAKST